MEIIFNFSIIEFAILLFIITAIFSGIMLIPKNQDKMIPKFFISMSLFLLTILSSISFTEYSSENRIVEKYKIRQFVEKQKIYFHNYNNADLYSKLSQSNQIKIDKEVEYVISLIEKNMKEITDKYDFKIRNYYLKNEEQNLQKIHSRIDNLFQNLYDSEKQISKCNLNSNKVCM